MKKISKKPAAAAGSDIRAQLLQAAEELAAGKGTHYAVTRTVRARFKLKVTKPEFAGMLGVSVRTLQAWETGSREPKGAALALIKVAQLSPRIFMKALRAPRQVERPPSS